MERLESYILKRNASIQQPVDWPQVEGVDSWLENIWWNLVSNAIQFGGNPPRIDLGWDRLDGEYRFWVRDNGAGIAEEIQPDLFQPFHQLHESTGRKGFGLSIVQRLVKLQNGDCGYTPVDGGGSCFYFTLPSKL